MDWERFYSNYREPDYLDGYEIVNKLGAGVFGEVYKIRKTSIGKFYAVKFLRVEDDSLKKAVLRELEGVKLLAQIDHPNLVSIEDQGEVDGIPYIIMSYAGEETLKSVLSRGTLPIERTIDYFRQVCSGVQALHDRSIIHFDLKPANIYIKGELARVGDYGLSKLISRTRRSLSFGRGTPYYMAPEMLHRRGDQRSDVYSLGVILYECVTGEVPFHGDTEWEVLKKHESGEIRFPDEVEERFRNAIRLAMAKDPDDRVQSAAELKRLIRPPTADLGGAPPPPETSSAPGAQPAARGPMSGPFPERADPIESPALSFLLAPLRLAWALVRNTALFLGAVFTAVAKVPLRLFEWGLHAFVFLVMVLIFFTVLHLVFKVPIILLRLIGG
jgi:serine/threonine-protein kinase